MNHSTPTPTKADTDRWNAIRAHGCICCQIRRVILQGQVEIHHLLKAGKRRGHRHTIGLCRWHHQGRSSIVGAEMNDLFGPSLAGGSKPFHEAFGSDDQLLAYQDELIGWTEAPPDGRKATSLSSAKVLAHSGVIS